MLPRFGNRAEYENNLPKEKGKNDCPFCKYDSPEEKDMILWEGKYLVVRYNKFPYMGLNRHLMLIPKKHLIYTHEMTDGELLEIKDAEKFISEFYKGEHYFSFIRQTVGGTSRSLEHFHYHYLPGEIFADNLIDMMNDQGIK